LNLISGEQFNISAEGLKAHKTRSFLTILGIIFGVAAVISMLAIGEGARRKTLNQIQSLGLKNIIIQNKEEDEDSNISPAFQLNMADREAINSILPIVAYSAPVVEEEIEVSSQNRFMEVTVTGTEPVYFHLINLKLVRGAFFTQTDNHLYQRVCVIGADVDATLFPLEDALGKYIKIENHWFMVVGVLQYQPVSVAGNIEVNLNAHVFIPVQTALVRFRRNPRKSELDKIIVQINDGKYVVSSADFIDRILFRRHNEENNSKLIVPEQLLRQSEETQKIFNIVMGAIAGISLLVGGIGIMNIMLASVLERTREIGIRRSLGATKLDIRNQFLAEAMILSLIGGVIGILIGYGLTFIVTFYSDWDTAVSLWSVILSFGVSSMVGILFGYYPAKKAADLSPIEALRHE
jgi:putative ABC transport system permease protein